MAIVRRVQSVVQEADQHASFLVAQLDVSWH